MIVPPLFRRRDGHWPSAVPNILPPAGTFAVRKSCQWQVLQAKEARSDKWQPPYHGRRLSDEGEERRIWPEKEKISSVETLSGP